MLGRLCRWVSRLDLVVVHIVIAGCVVELTFVYILVLRLVYIHMFGSALVCMVSMDCSHIVQIMFVYIIFTRAVSITVSVRTLGAGRARVVKSSLFNAIRVFYCCFISAVVNSFPTFFKSVVYVRSKGVDFIFHVSELTVGVFFRTICT